MITRLVLLPGMHGTGELFSDFVRMMLESPHMEAPHYPTDASLSYSQLLAVVQSFVPSSAPYFLLAESYSTPLAIQFAATNPPNLRGLILCAGFAASPIRGWRKLLASLIGPLVFRLPLSKAAVSYYLVGRSAPESLQTAVRSAIRSVEPAVFAARLLQVLEVDARAELAQVIAPILYLQATDDRLVPASCLEEIQRIKPQTEVVKIAGPHLILQREPEKTAKAIARFMEQLG
jgi:pimeloyl-[acyl-carrier protein] methyl ester esterase